MDARDELLLEHQDVESLLQGMRHAVARDDPRALYEAWSRFERDLGDHMRFEEGELLSRFANVDPVEANGLRAEHDHIRELVAELGVSADLHTMRLEVAEQLLEALREHVRREEQGLYRWASENLPAATLEGSNDERLGREIRRLLDHARASLHELRVEAQKEVAAIQREAEEIRRQTAHVARERYQQLIERLRRIATPRD